MQKIDEFHNIYEYVPPTETKQVVWKYINSALALLGAMFCWCGFWTLVDIDSKVSSNIYQISIYIIYLILGTTLLLLTRTFFLVAQVDGAEIPANYILHLSMSLSSQIKVFLFSVFVLFSAIFYWVGAYNLIDALFPASTNLYIHGFTMVLGVIFFMLAKRIFGETTDQSYITVFLRAFISLIGSVLLWHGSWSILDQHTFSLSWYRDLLFSIAGILIFLITGTLHWSAATEYIEMPPIYQYDKLFIYFTKLIIGGFGGILWWNGFWNILILWIWPQGAYIRDIIFIFLGIIICTLTRSLWFDTIDVIIFEDKNPLHYHPNHIPEDIYPLIKD